MATHSSILAWRIPWTEEPAGYGPWGCKESDTIEQLTLLLFKIFPKQTYGFSLRVSLLEISLL